MPTVNRIPQTASLRNRYFAMRHGHSLANEQGIIVSHPRNGRGGFGLSARGRRQVAASLNVEDRLDAATLIVSSDFDRALESAQIAHGLLGCHADIRVDQRLRERDFGELEFGSNLAYEGVWARDAADPDDEYRGVESANRVMLRVTSLIAELEADTPGATFLLVSHGDCLQLLQTAFCREDASRHRSLEHLETAEIRLLRPV